MVNATFQTIYGFVLSADIWAAGERTTMVLEAIAMLSSTSSQADTSWLLNLGRLVLMGMLRFIAMHATMMSLMSR